jgi:hypothetical protein
MQRYTVIRRHGALPYIVIDSQAAIHPEVAEYATLNEAQYAVRTGDWNLLAYVMVRNEELLSTIQGRLEYMTRAVSELRANPLDAAALKMLTELCDSLQLGVDTIAYVYPTDKVRLVNAAFKGVVR